MHLGYLAEYEARWNIEYSIIFHMVQVHEVNVTVCPTYDFAIKKSDRKDEPLRIC